MRPGSPTSAGTSNASMARMKTSIASARMDGSESRKVTRRMVIHDAGTAHARGFLQLRIGVAQRRAHQEKRQRRPQEALDHDHPGHGIDVDQNVGGAGNAAVELIDRAGLAEQQQPRRHIKNVRRSERDDRGEIGQRLERRIGALDDPGGGPADRQRDHRAAGREHERVGADGKEAPTPQHRFEVGQAPFAAALRVHDTGFEQKHERRQHQRGEHDDQDRRKQRRLVSGETGPKRRDHGIAWRCRRIPIGRSDLARNLN